MLDTMGIIFAQNEGIRLGDLTRVRALASLPVAGRYRLIDFILSNFVNSGISNVGVTTKYNYQSLMDHLGGGLPWDLSRKKYGLYIWPPFYKQDSELHMTGEDKIAILHSIVHYIRRSQQKYVLLADSNVMCNMTFDDAMEKHKNSNADITIIYNEMVPGAEHDDNEVYIDMDETGRVVDIDAFNKYSKFSSKALGFYIIEGDLLVNLVESCIARGEKSFEKDILARNLGRLKVVGYNYKGFVRTITDINSYYNFNMELLNDDVRKCLFESHDRILTKVKDKVPARYLKHAKVSNSFIADGCIIDGEVEGCILFRGVEVRKGCKLKNCVIMQDSKIMENSVLSHVILDKQVFVDRDKILCGDASYPLVVGKNRRI